MSDAVGDLSIEPDRHEAYSELLTRVDQLETELERERERRRELENLIDIRTPPERDKAYLEDLFIANLPVGRSITSRAAQSDLEDLRDSLQRHLEEQLQGGNRASHDDALPIMQLTNTWKSEPAGLSATQRRAAQVWSDFFDYCNTTRSRYVLDSNAVEKILASHDENQHRQTRKDVMELVGELGRQYIEVDDHNGRLALVIRRNPFEEYVSGLEEADP